MGRYLGTTALTYLWEKIKELFSTGTAGRAQGIPFGKVDSTSTATAFTATVDGITELKAGTCVYLMNGVVTSAAATTTPKCFTLDINGLGAKPVYYTVAAASYATTQFDVSYTMLFVYNTTRVSTGCWDIFYGYDSNTNTIGYQLRTNSSTLPAKFKTYRYRLLFTSANHAHFVAANASTSTDANTSKTVTTEKIDPFGPIVYYGYTTAISANANFSATYLWIQYTLNIGYSFNNTGAAPSLTFPAPIYIKAAPQSDGSAIIDATTPYVQALPSTEDGKIYIFLGLAYSATDVELRTEHPVYYYKGGCIRQWTNAAETDISGKANTADLADVAFSGSYNDLEGTPTIPAAVTESTVSGWGFTKNTGTYSKPSGGIPKSDLADAVQTSLGKADTALQSFTETDPTVPAWAKAANKPTYTAAEVGALPDTTTIPAAPGTLNTNNSIPQAVSSSESLSGTISLHKVSKTGSYGDLNNRPTLKYYNPETTTVPNVTSAGSASTWSFAMGTGSDEHTLIISGGNGTAPSLGTVITVATGRYYTDTNPPERISIFSDGILSMPSAGGGSND